MWVKKGTMFLLTLLLLTACGTESVDRIASGGSVAEVNSNQEKVSSSNSSTTASFRVSDMYCASCPFVVESAIKQVDGVGAVTIETEQTEATVDVTFDEEKTNLKAIQEAVSDLGYGVQ